MNSVEICLVYCDELNHELLRNLSNANNVRTFNFEINNDNKEIDEYIFRNDLIITDFKSENLLNEFYFFYKKWLSTKVDWNNKISWFDISTRSLETINKIGSDQSIDFVDGSILNLTDDSTQGILILSGNQEISETVVSNSFKDFFRNVFYLGEKFVSKIYKNAFLISIAGNAMALAEAFKYCEVKQLDFNKVLDIVDDGAGSSTFLQIFGNSVMWQNFKPSNLSISRLIEEYDILINHSKINLNVVNCFKECLEELENKSLGIESIVKYYNDKSGNNV